MPYIGNDIQFGELTSQTFTGDGSTVAFTMGYSVANTTSILVTSGNVVQEPTVAYTVSGTTLTFTSAPEDDDTIHVRFLGRVVDVANAAILQDSDQDTKVQVEESADEDTIRFDIAGAEDFTMTANSFNVLAGSSIDMNGTELILDADADTTITADTDDTIDIKIAGADDFKFTANDFTALSGSVISTNTINETTAASGVTIDGVVMKDTGVATDDIILGGTKMLAIRFHIYNQSGTLKHFTYNLANNGSNIGGYDGGINGLVVGLTVTPTGADGSTAFAAGAKIGSATTSYIWFDTGNISISNVYLTGHIVENRCSPSAPLNVDPQCFALDINGTTATRLVIGHKFDTGVAFAINTTNIAATKLIAYNLLGYVEPA
jgi:hypothetical protein